MHILINLTKIVVQRLRKKCFDHDRMPYRITRDLVRGRGEEGLYPPSPSPPRPHPPQFGVLVKWAKKEIDNLSQPHWIPNSNGAYD